MRILTKMECGLIIMTDIALNSENGRAVTLYEMSERRCISVKYLEQLITRLRQCALVKSLKGPHGGYILARSADKITMKDIIDAIDINFISNDIAQLDECNSVITDVLDEKLWTSIETYLTNLTSSVTLLDIAQAFRKKALSQEQTMMYYI